MAYQVHFVHVNEDYVDNVAGALDDAEGLMVIGIFFEATDELTNIVSSQVLKNLKCAN